MKDVILKNVILHTIAFLVMITLIGVASGVLVEEGDYGNFSLDNVITVWDGTQAYWIIKDPYGTVISYWTFPQVQSFKTQGKGQWQYEVPINETENYTYYSPEGIKIKVLNYTLGSGSIYSIILEEYPDKIKMSFGVYGAYNREYRIDLTSNSVPSNKAYLDIIRKIFEWTDSIRYNFSDVTTEVFSSVDANKNFHQYISMGNAYNTWVWIDPLIEISENVRYADNPPSYSVSSLYTKIKEITLNESYTGSFKITYIASCIKLIGGSRPGCDYRVYKDGVAWGDNHHLPITVTYAFTDSFSSLNVSNGSKIQMYVRGMGDKAQVSWFSIRFDYVNETPPENETQITYIYPRNGHMLISILIYLSVIQLFIVIVVTYNSMRRSIQLV